MATNAQLAAKLLRDSAEFFRTLGDQNPPIKERMNENAQALDIVANLIETDPTGELPGAETNTPVGSEE